MIRLDELPAPAPLTRGGVTLSARQLGAEYLPAALAIHGGPGLDHHVLLPLALLLPAFRWTLPDLPAHGESPFPSRDTPGLQWIELRLERWAARLGAIDLLVAHSLGAWLAMNLIRRRVIAPRNTVLISPPAARGDRRGVRRNLAPLFEPRTSARASLEAHVRAECGGQIPPELEQVIGISKLRHPRDYGSLLRSLGRAMEGPPRGIPAPTRLLLICGDEDRTTPPSDALTIASLSEGAETAIVEGTGHWAVVRRPEEIAGLIASFIARDEGQPGSPSSRAE
jgi:magnesium chelatase accessory protein